MSWADRSGLGGLPVMAEYLVALRSFKHRGRAVRPGDVLVAAQVPNRRSMIESGFVKEGDDMADKYDPKELARAAKAVDENVTPGDPGNPRTEVVPVQGVPNPNVEVYVAEPDGDPRDAQVDPEQPSVADTERAKTPLVAPAPGEDGHAAEGVDAEQAGNTPQDAETVDGDDTATDDATDDGLDAMTVPQLKARAEAEGVEVKGSKKAAYITALRGK